MMNKHAIRVSAVVLACGLAAAWAGDSEPRQEPPTADSPDVQVKPPPRVIHTPGGVKLERGDVEVSRFDTVTLNVQDADLADVLEMLSVQGQRNIVLDPKVSGRVTANLYDVTFHEALDAILAQAGAGYIEQGNFIRVYTLDDLRKIREAERKQVRRVFRLNYMNARDATLFVTPLLSPNGKITAIAPVEAGFQPDIQRGGENSSAAVEILMVRDFEENVDDIARLVAELDTPPLQVLIEATVLRANLTEDLALGVDLSILFDGSGTGGFDELTGSALNFVQGTIQGENNEGVPHGAVNTGVGNTAAPGGMKVGILTHNVALFIRALDEVTDTTVLANPKVMTLNRQRADVLVGEKIGYLSTTATATATTQTVEYLETGTQLTVRPFVSTDGTIRMELKPSISSAALRDAIGATIPDESTQELTTNVMVRDGQTVVLGGLFQEETTVTRRQVPGLGDVPVLGWAFKGKEDAVERNEVIFLVTPHIITDNMAAAAGDSVLEDIERVRVGSRQKLLPWSRSRWSSAHLRDALDHAEAGETEKAMWHVDKALSFDPGFPEARRLKERLTGERKYIPTRSIAEEAVDMMVGDQAGRRTRTRVEVEPNPIPVLPTPAPGFDPAAEGYVPPPPPPVPPPPAPEDERSPVLDEELDVDSAPPPPRVPPTPPADEEPIDAPPGIEVEEAPEEEDAGEDAEK